MSPTGWTQRGSTTTFSLRPPAAARQADEAHLVHRFRAAEARAAFVADDIGFHHHVVPDGEPGHTLPQFLDGAGELVSRGDGASSQEIGWGWPGGGVKMGPSRYS